MVLRRPPFGNQVKTAHDMGREYRVLSRLCAVYPPRPGPLLYCEDESVLGAPFYVMERRHGVILRKDLPAGPRRSMPRPCAVSAWRSSTTWRSCTRSTTRRPASATSASPTGTSRAR